MDGRVMWPHQHMPPFFFAFSSSAQKMAATILYSPITVDRPCYPVGIVTTEGASFSPVSTRVKANIKVLKERP
jgi:hypothetical protein